jgi:PleD family two-component response regulator
MPEKTPDQHELDALLADIEALRQALCEAHAEFCVADGQDPLLGVFRLLPGLRPEQWTELAQKHGLSHWLTLPVEGSVYPHLRVYQEALERLTYQTDHDPLTGLANRRAFERSLDMEIERARRSRQPVCLALLDLDDFKAVNDTYGHLAGDEVLRGLSPILGRNKRRYDLAARIGGEEFALVPPGWA